MLNDLTMSVVFDGSVLKAMQSSHSLPTQTALSTQELSQEIKSFISGVDAIQGRKLSVREHARCAVRLLRSVPACRGAVLEHLRGVYDEHVSAFLHNLETENNLSSGVSSNLEDIIQEVHGVLSDFIRLNPRAWAPLVSTWAVDLLGQLSSKHAGRRVAPHSSSLNELLQLWMSCAATRSLMETYSQCLAAMLAWCPDACVDALLDTSVQHSPHFDWVVAHIGSAFPGTIISRVLACGLKDFCSHGAKDQSLLVMGVDKGSRVPKIGSVVGILGHLAAHHSDSIRKELLRMFQESLNPSGPLSPTSTATSWESSPQLRCAAVPFLLQLAAMSPGLFGAVSAELVELLRPPVLLQLQTLLQGLPREELDNMLGLAVHLISQSPSGGARVLKFLANTATPASVIISGPTPSPREGVREGCDRLLQMLLLHLHKLVFNRSDGAEVNSHNAASAASQPQRVVPFLEELRSHVGQLCAETLRLERKRHLWLHQLLCLLSLYGGPGVATETLCQFLTRARNPEELALAWQLHSTLSSSMAGLISAAVTRCVAQIHTHTLGPRELKQLLLNLCSVIQSQDDERRGAGLQSSMAGQLGSAVSENLLDFCQLLLHGDPAVARAAARLLCRSPFPRAASPTEQLLFSKTSAAHFFSALRWRRGATGDDGQASEAVRYSALLLSRLAAYSTFTLKTVLQLLVESSLHSGNAELFGGQIADMSGAPVVSPSESPNPGASLLGINCWFGTTINFSSSVWSVFHAGVIGKGLKVRSATMPPDPSGHLQNIQTLLAVIVQCCTSSGVNGSQASSDNDEAPPINAEVAKILAGILVENVCPDVANGELPWPPEEHARTTVERDIHIKRCFEAHPVLFGLLQVIAAGRPALCYCSAVLRGLLAALLAYWDASREPSSADSPWHLRASCLLVSCMGEGQLLPPILANVYETFPHLAPFEVRLLLLAVWEYVRGNGPLPQKFAFNPEKGLFCRDFSRDGDVARYVAPIHSVLHKNIDRLGHLCWRFQL